jgi:hypothetical protein
MCLDGGGEALSHAIPIFVICGGFDQGFDRTGPEIVQCYSILSRQRDLLASPHLIRKPTFSTVSAD